MNSIIIIVQIIISLVLVGLILLQGQGGGLGSAWGGSGAFYSSKRGVEKFVLYLTIIFTVFFFVSSILNLIF